jgi:ribonuclease VapC
MLRSRGNPDAMRYGKGRKHRASLNFGDCLSYACAKAHGARLLFRGEDLAHTDVARAWAKEAGE